jgi:hypothetical protein
MEVKYSPEALVAKQINNKEKASRQTHTQEPTKLTKKNKTEKHKWKLAKCDHVQKKRRQKPAKQIPSGT